MSRPTWRFVRHYLEMLAAMAIGMVVLGAASDAVLELPDRTAAAHEPGRQAGTWLPPRPLGGCVGVRMRAHGPERQPPAASRSSSARSTRSHGRSRSLRPKWP